MTAAGVERRPLHEIAATRDVDPEQRRIVADAIAHARAAGLVLPAFEVRWVSAPSHPALATTQVPADPQRPIQVIFRAEARLSPAALFAVALHELRHVADADLVRRGMPVAELEARADRFSNDVVNDVRRSPAMPHTQPLLPPHQASRSALLAEGHTLLDRAARERRAFTPAERRRGEAILAELDATRPPGRAARPADRCSHCGGRMARWDFTGVMACDACGRMPARPPVDLVAAGRSCRA